MDLGISDGGGFAGDDMEHQQTKQSIELPSDLPKSLDDRRRQPVELPPETEFYDGWQGKQASSFSPSLPSFSLFFLFSLPPRLVCLTYVFALVTSLYP